MEKKIQIYQPIFAVTYNNQDSQIKSFPKVFSQVDCFFNLLKQDNNIFV